MKTLSTALLAALIAFTLACGYSSKATTPAVAGSMPSIAELAPDNTNSGGTAFVLTVNGSNFSSKATINWNGTAQTTTYVSASQLTATIAAADIATPATVPITVTNPATSGTGVYGSGGTLAETSSAMNFTVN
ncbi:MAG: IPT/TIG domain-containing protein [Candidatus Sulfotelmatobacter sp.]